MKRRTGATIAAVIKEQAARYPNGSPQWYAVRETAFALAVALDPLPAPVIDLNDCGLERPDAHARATL